ncbi:MAG: ATPase [Pseudomonadales bacterium]|nr:ATPase [Pseudomonadales bacterium]MBO6596101.1 ATPase [Pseudomonadales bacterium]MBO6822583.1 ATPase [Pseudomonadales bacterium]
MSALQALQDYFRSRPPMAVAVSGGVDSMTLAVIAHRANPDTQIFHAISPAVPGQATDRVKAHAEKEGWSLNVIDAGEMHDPQYLANPANRCYFCKTNLYDTVVENTELAVASGTNTDDLGDYRPGLIAAEEHQVCHPYVEVGVSKAMLREVANELGLHDLKDLPAAPCLSSRVTTGIPIDEKMLPVINEVEELLWQGLSLEMALKGIRCRIRENEVAIQVETISAIDFDMLAEKFSGTVVDQFTAAGFSNQVASVVFEPYEKGSAFLIETLEVTESPA